MITPINTNQIARDKSISCFVIAKWPFPITTGLLSHQSLNGSFRYLILLNSFLASHLLVGPQSIICQSLVWLSLLIANESDYNSRYVLRFH